MEKNNQPNSYDIIVVGAGISGVACANFLSENNIKCLVLEARDRIGGRIHTKEFSSIKVDMGVCFIHGATTENPVYNLLNEFNLKQSIPQAFGTKEIYYDGRNFEKVLSYKERSHVENTFNYVIKRVLKKRDEMINNASTGSVLNEKLLYTSVTDEVNNILSNPKFEMKNWDEESSKQHYWNYLVWVYEEYEGINFDKQSLISYQSESSFEGGNTTLQDGYISLVNKLSQNISIELKTIVDSIQNYTEDKVIIQTNKGTLTCNKVVLSVPISILKK